MLQLDLACVQPAPMENTLLPMLAGARTAPRARSLLRRAVRLRASRVLPVRTLEQLPARVLTVLPVNIPSPVLAVALPAPLASMPRPDLACARRVLRANGLALGTAHATIAMRDIIPPLALEAAHTALRASILLPPVRECALRVPRAHTRVQATARAPTAPQDDTAPALAPAAAPHVLQARIQVPAPRRLRATRAQLGDIQSQE